MFSIYLLVNTSNNRTYIGSTNNQQRRIRQHNGELVGGAKYTTANKGLGEWKYYGTIDGLEKSTSYSIERKIQIRTRILRKLKVSSLERRLAAISQILAEHKIKTGDEYFFNPYEHVKANDYYQPE